MSRSRREHGDYMPMSKQPTALNADRLKKDLDAKANATLDRLVVGRRLHDAPLMDAVEAFYKDISGGKYGPRQPLMIYASEGFMREVVDLRWDKKSSLPMDVYDEIISKAGSIRNKMKTPQEALLARIGHVARGYSRFSIEGNLSPSSENAEVRRYLKAERIVVQKILGPELGMEDRLEPLCVSFGRLSLSARLAWELQQQDALPDIEFPRIVELGPLEVMSLRA